MIAKRHQLLIAKNRKTISHIAVVELLVSEKNSKQDSDKIHYYDKLRHTNNIKVRTILKESGSYENDFSELALPQNTLELTLKKIKPEET